MSFLNIVIVLSSSLRHAKHGCIGTYLTLDMECESLTRNQAHHPRVGRGAGKHDLKGYPLPPFSELAWPSLRSDRSWSFRAALRRARRGSPELAVEISSVPVLSSKRGIATATTIPKAAIGENRGRGLDGTIGGSVAGVLLRGFTTASPRHAQAGHSVVVDVNAPLAICCFVLNAGWKSRASPNSSVKGSAPRYRGTDMSAGSFSFSSPNSGGFPELPIVQSKIDDPVDVLVAEVEAAYLTVVYRERER